MTTADIPKVQVRDTRTGRIVAEGYYFEMPEWCPYPMYEGKKPDPPPTAHCVVFCEYGDWGMANRPRILRVTPPHEIVMKEAEPCGN